MVPSLYVREGGPIEELLRAMNTSDFPSKIIIRRPFAKDCHHGEGCSRCKEDYIFSCLRIWDTVAKFPMIEWRMTGMELEPVSVLRLSSGTTQAVIGALSDNEDYGDVMYNEVWNPRTNDTVGAVEARVKRLERCSVQITEELFDLVTEIPLKTSQVLFTEGDTIQVGNRHRGTTCGMLQTIDEDYWNFLVEKQVVALILAPL